jgi:hypothetical protein
LRNAIHFATFAMLGLASFAAAAQGDTVAAPATDQGIALAIGEGNVLVSTGGEFTQLPSGQVLSAGDRVMVPEGGHATLTYDDGCEKALSAPGVYTLTPDCSGAAAGRGAPGTGAIVGIAVGVAGIAAAVGGGGGDDAPPPPPPPPPPVSR